MTFFSSSVISQDVLPSLSSGMKMGISSISYTKTNNILRILRRLFRIYKYIARERNT